MSTIKKGRLWGFVCYPESVPLDWLDYLQNTGLEIAISPLHNMDIEPTGEIKKEHWHVILKYDGPTTYNHVKEITDYLNAPRPIKLEGLRGMYRYHLHLDNPEKYQYNDNDRILLNGFDTSAVNGLTETEINKIKWVLTDMIEKENILEYRDLIVLLKNDDCNELFEVASKNVVFLNAYIKSKKYKTLDKKEK